MKDVSEGLKGSSDRVKGHAEDVRRGADGARAGAEAGDLGKVRKETQNLRKTADNLDQEALKLQESRSRVDALREELRVAGNQSAELKSLYEQCQKEVSASAEKFEKEREAYKKQIEELSSERDSALQKVLLAMIVGSIGLTAISVALCIYGNSRMIIGACTGLVTLGIAMAMRTHGKIFATGMGITIAIIIGLIIYQVFRSKRSEKALEETVHSVEAMKQSLEEEDRQRIFGSGAHTGMLHTIQSESTQELVQEKRLQLKPKLKHTMD
jgi:biopolymer transport protein ExbB/TolQ